jgi:hypothetical protein
MSMNIAKALVNDSEKGYLAIPLGSAQFVRDFDLNPNPAAFYEAFHKGCDS